MCVKWMKLSGSLFVQKQGSGLKGRRIVLKGVIPVNKEKLKQYRSLIREIPKIKKEISMLYEKLDKVPVIAGKVTKSGKDFPYIKGTVTVLMEEPKAATEIKKQIRLKELRLEKAEKDKTAIEEFIAGIEDSTDRMIFELLYLNDRKMSQTKVGCTVGYSQGRISQIIKKNLKD